LPGDLAGAIAEKVPGVDLTCRLTSTRVWIGIGNVLFQETIGLTDTTYLEIFDFPVLAGDPVNPLSDPFAVVLTATVADKFFGDTIEDYNEVIGEIIEFPQRSPNIYTITAVLEDPPDNNSFRWTALIPYEQAHLYPGCNDTWGNSSVYVLLDERNEREQVEQVSQSLVEEVHGERIRQNANFRSLKEGEYNFRYIYQPLKELYLDSDHFGGCYEKKGSKRSIHVLSSIAVLILLIACFNYVMLSIGSSMNRLKDFGMMNVVGARRDQILRHFISESTLLAIFSLFLGIILAEQILPLFNQLARDNLQFTLYADWRNIVFLALILLFIVFTTGMYIGFYMLRRNQPIHLLRKEMISLKRNRGSRFFVILQYFITITLLISSGVILKQLNYMIGQDVGFEKENLLVLQVDFGRRKLLTLKDRLLQSPHVLDVTMGDRDFASGSSSNSEKNAEGEIVTIRFLRIDYDYIPTIGLTLLEGRNFFREAPADSNMNVIVNEEFVRQYRLEDPVSTKIEMNGGKTSVTIIGVVRDFHFDSMHDEIQPVMLIVYTFNRFWALFIKIDDDYEAAIAQVEEAWMEIVPEYSFNYKFMADHLATWYSKEDRWSRIIAYSAGIAIFLSCLGLMGISGLLTARRFKEIGVRKAQGASVRQIIVLLNTDILKWVLISFTIACPVAYYIMQRWLQNFAFRTSLSWWIFALAGIVALLISLLTISLQICRAARQNPVNALRYE
jgi:putative ABC transport system permease protein